MEATSTGGTGGTDLEPTEKDSQEAIVDDEASKGPAVTVKNLGGDTIVEVAPIPPTAADLKKHIWEKFGTPVALQQLLLDGATMAGDEALDPAAPFEMLLLLDDTPLYTWNIDDNPDRERITAEGSRVEYTKPQWDYINVITQEPIMGGQHYFEFVMHKIGDEQWCGLTTDPNQAGHKVSGRALNGCFYYCGRRGDYGDVTDGLGALHVENKAVKQFKKVKDGQTIGMLVDMEQEALVFSHDGEVQGACTIPKQPQYILTHLDRGEDVVELRKPPVDEAPPEMLEALKDPMLSKEVKGKPLRGWIFDG